MWPRKDSRERGIVGCSSEGTNEGLAHHLIIMNKDDIAKHYSTKHATDKAFSRGTALLKHIPEIAQLARENHCESILDFGCGKALFWNSPLWKPIFNQSIKKLTLHDPYIAKYSKNPLDGPRHDMVVCTDVMEHVPEEDTDEFLKTLFKCARRLVFMNISTVPARKTFKDGTNLHINLKTEKEWIELINKHRVLAERKYNTNYRVVLRFDDQVGAR